MYFFSSEDEKKLDQTQCDKLYLADRLIEDIDEALKDKGEKNLRSIKSAILDIVALENVLKKLGFKCELKKDLRKIRNSLAHLDERMEAFNFQPVKINGFKVTRKTSGSQFKNSLSINFQGAVTSAGVSIPVNGADAHINVVSLFGMVDDNFLWVNENGIQKFTRIETITKEYKEFLETLKKAKNGEA